MSDELNIIERSLHGYPGRISAIINLADKKDVSEIKNRLLNDNPMLTALFLNGSEWKHHEELAEWGKKNELKIGISADNLSSEEIKKAVESGSIDFVRMHLKKESCLKQKIGIVRSSGIKHEFVFELEKNDLNEVENMYKSVSPCDSFIVEVDSKVNPKTRESLMNLAYKYKSMLLRIE